MQPTFVSFSDRKIRLLPLGNMLIDGKSNHHRSNGLGVLDLLPDQTLFDIICRNLCPDSLISLALSSKYFYSFAASPEIWMNLVVMECLKTFDGCVPINYEKSWARTFICLRALSAKQQLPDKKFLTDQSTTDISNAITCDVKGSDKITLYSDFLFHRKRCFSFFRNDVCNPLWRQKNIQRIDGSKTSLRDFVMNFEKAGKPCIITDVLPLWKIFKKWSSLENLRTEIGETSLSAGPVKVSLQWFEKYINEEQDECPLFIFDKNWFTNSTDSFPSEEFDSYPFNFFTSSRDLFCLLDQRPDHKWLLIGGAGSGSKWHIDPNRTSAWNAVISGSKKWLLLPPGLTPPGVFPSLDGSDVVQPVSIAEWYVNYYKDIKKKPYSRSLVECVVSAGEIMFIPSEWWHCVVNCFPIESGEDMAEIQTQNTNTLVVAVTQNYAPFANLDRFLDFFSNYKYLISGIDETLRAQLGSNLERALQSEQGLSFIHQQSKVLSDDDETNVSISVKKPRNS